MTAVELKGHAKGDLGDWMLASSGTRVDLWETKPEQINIDDIAWHLTGVMRFTGAGKRSVSVAEHSMRVHDMLRYAGASPAACLWGLLHDAHEAYVSDISTPLKRTIAAVAGRDVIKEIEAKVDAAIREALNLPLLTDEEAKLVKLADYWAMAFEKNALLPYHAEWHFDLAESPFRDGADVEKDYGLSRDEEARYFTDEFRRAHHLVVANQRIRQAIAE
jgi:5'-deoxynucleotidase YfbR-like HD superfamily hydrolase